MIVGAVCFPFHKDLITSINCYRFSSTLCLVPGTLVKPYLLVTIIVTDPVQVL